MAQYHLRVKIISRGGDGSAVEGAAYRSGGVVRGSVLKGAAYRAGERLTEAVESGIVVHDYSRKQDVLHTQIIAPADAPAWVYDRSSLWGAVEAGEKRKDAQLAREVEVMLPRELSIDAHHALLRGFVEREFVAKGMVADVAIHNHTATDGGDHPHAHILLTLRPMTADGFAAKKPREWNDKALLAHWREAWAEAVNTALDEAGQADRVDHRSLKERGIERAAQPVRGRVANALYKKGKEFVPASEIAQAKRTEQVIAQGRDAVRAAMRLRQARAPRYSTHRKARNAAPDWSVEQLLWQWLGNQIHRTMGWIMKEAGITPPAAVLFSGLLHQTMDEWINHDSKGHER